MELPAGLNFKYESSDEEPEQPETVEHDLIDGEGEEERKKLELPSIEREPIEPEEIFDKPEPPKVKRVKQPNIDDIVNEETGEENPNFVYDEPEQPKKKKGVNKNGKPRKPMSEEHKAKLAVARDRANAERKRLKMLREEDNDKKKKIKELSRKKIDLEYQKLNQEVETAKQRVKPKKKKKVVVSSSESESSDEEVIVKKSKSKSKLTKEDLQISQMETIMAYEKIRKARKEEKRKLEQQQKRKQDIIDTIQGKPDWKQVADVFQNCF